MNRIFKTTSAFRYLGLALAVIGVLLWSFTSAANNEIPLLVGLYILFIARVGREDERSVSLRNSSTYIAVLVAYGLKILISNLYSQNLISFQLSEVNHFLILLFALSIIIFYCRLYITWGKAG